MTLREQMIADYATIAADTDDGLAEACTYRTKAGVETPVGVFFAEEDPLGESRVGIGMDQRQGRCAGTCSRFTLPAIEEGATLVRADGVAWIIDTAQPIGAHAWRLALVVPSQTGLLAGRVR